MPGLFQGLEIGKRALLATQLALNTTGHNISNVDTPGYSRQRVSLKSALPEYSTLGAVGTGVEVDDIRHVRDLFLGGQYREQSKSLGQWSFKEKIMTEVESMFNEPDENALGDLLNEFWDSWSSLSTFEGTRTNLVSVTERLVAGFHLLDTELTRLRDSVDQDIDNLTQEVNAIASEIALLNNQVKRTELDGTRANDLRDRRDLLLDELSSMIDVNSHEMDTGEVTVYIGAMAIVDGPDTIRIATKETNIDGQSVHQLVWEGTDVTLTNLNGELKGLVDTRDKIIPGYIEQLDQLAQTIVEQVNAIHVTGYGANGTTGIFFFDPDCVEAGNIRLSSEIQHDPSRIAVSLTGEEGDQQIAAAIAALNDAEVMQSGTLTMNEFYNALVSSIGSESKAAQTFASNYDLMVQQIDYTRQSIQGVSLDEEMTNMIKYQQAFDAAARVITTMDEALDTIISGMGIVGR